MTMTITGTPNTKVQSPCKRARPSLTTTGTPRQKKKQNSVRFSPKKKSYLADDYDRTPPELDVFDCDGCAIKILGDRHHCQQCDFDLCPNCAPKVKMQHEHDEFEIIPGGDDGVNDNDNDNDEVSGNSV
jgi:hypothetical protein